MTKPRTESLLSEFLDVNALAAEVEAERPTGNDSMLAEFLDVDVSAPRGVPGRLTPAQIRSEQVRRDVADRLGVPVDPEAA